MIVLRRTLYLAPPPRDGPVFHAATYLRRSPGWGHARLFSRFNRQVETQIAATPGALSYTLQRLLMGPDFWTLSLWSDRQSMLAFVRAGSHRLAADWLGASGKANGKFAQWESPRPSLSMEDAYARLAVPAPRGRVLQAPAAIPAGWRNVPR